MKDQKEKEKWVKGNKKKKSNKKGTNVTHNFKGKNNMIQQETLVKT